MTPWLKGVLGTMAGFVWGMVAWTFTESTLIVMAGAVAIGWLMTRPPRPPRRRRSAFPLVRLGS